MGLFDDGILGSETDLGTFGVEPGSEAGWGSPWSTEDELIFEEQLCRYVPQGGEVLETTITYFAVKSKLILTA